MMKYKFLLSLLLCIGVVRAERVDTLADVLPYIDGETLVVFDIHNTLLRPAQQLGTYRWALYLVEQLSQTGMPINEVKGEVAQRLFNVARISEMIPCETCTPQIVRDLQDAGVQIMALTASANDFREVVPDQLLKASIDLKRTAPSKDAFALDLPGAPEYADGILYGNHTDKGDALTVFFSLAGIRPSRVVFIDDRQKHVDEVVRALSQLDVDVVGIRYDAGINAEDPIDPEIVELQWKMLGRVLTDEQARILLEHQRLEEYPVKLPAQESAL